MSYRLTSKRPSEVRTYTHDWSAFLGEDTIASSAWTVAGVTKDSESNDTATASIVVSAGTDGTIATLINSIVTAGGAEEDETFTLRITTTSEPITLTEAKKHLRKTTDDEDGLICSYIAGAREWCEDYTGHILVEREMVASFTQFGDYLTIHAAPNVVIDSIAYVNADGDVADFAYFAYPAGINPVKIYPPDTGWPEIDENSAIAVTYTAGYGQGEVPEKFVWAIKLLVSSMFMNRGTIDEATMNAARFILRSYRGVVAA